MARKISEQTATALKNLIEFKGNNTRVIVQNGYAACFLWENLIATYDSKTKTLSVSDAGWATVTTTERLNVILDTFGTKVRLKKRNGELIWSDGFVSETRSKRNFKIQ